MTTGTTGIGQAAVSRHTPTLLVLLARANPIAFSASLWRQRDLIRQLTWREVTGRYRSSLLGIGWSFVTPLVMLALYTFVFGVVFKARWQSGATDDLREFGLMLFAGLTAFSLFSECVTRAPSLIASSPNYVKKVVFPLEILPVTVVGSALFHACVSLAILLIARSALVGLPGWTVLLLPVVLVPIVCLALGLSWFLASLGVFLRDIGHSVALATQIVLFATPIFYPPSAVPRSLQPMVVLNPLSGIVENVRRVAVSGQLPDWSAWAYSAIVGAAMLSLGHAWFASTKRAFGDVV
jgi:lipopolysaccharide transport system permease protein